MEQKYYSVKVTISPVLDNAYRSRIEPQSPDGANFGAGNDFKLVPAVDIQVPTVEEFSKRLSVGTVTRDMSERFGKWLFDSVFQGAVRDKYSELKGIARSRNCKLRICLALHSLELANTAWEFLHDGTNFLTKHDYQVVRVLDELVGAKSSFAPIRSVLIAVANPKSEDYDSFDATTHVEQITALLDGSHITLKVLAPASREELLAMIRSKGFDALYFVGHGEALKSGGQLICEGADASPEPLTANDLAAAVRQVENLRFVYLNSCSTARTGQDNPFQGVAQRLMLDGGVAAVAAMQVDVKQDAALDMAKTFFRELMDKSPEEAMHVARAGAKDDGYSFGVPVLYTYLDAPDQYERNCLEALLNARTESKYALILPSFYLGQPAEDGQPEAPQDKKYRYIGETFAREDAEAAVNVINLLSRVTRPGEILISMLRNDLPKDCTHYFLFGSRSNHFVNAVLTEFPEKFEFKFSDEEWLIRDKEYKHEYKVLAPNKLALVAYRDRDDYGVIQKIRADDRVYFLLAGLGSRATQGCGWYLYRKWRSHVTSEDFAIVLKFPGGLDFGQARVVDRETGKPRSSA